LFARRFGKRPVGPTALEAAWAGRHGYSGWAGTVGAVGAAGALEAPTAAFAAQKPRAELAGPAPTDALKKPTAALAVPERPKLPVRKVADPEPADGSYAPAISWFGGA
jgi:hypothetical protein